MRQCFIGTETRMSKIKTAPLTLAAGNHLTAQEAARRFATQVVTPRDGSNNTILARM